MLLQPYCLQEHFCPALWTQSQMIRGGVSQSPKITGITASPAEPTPGAQVTLSVTATSPDGGTLSYQWYTVSDGKNTPLPGATKNPYSYKIPADTPDGSKITFCAQVTNTVSGKDPASALSGNASVTVKKKAPTSAETPTVTVTSNGGIADTAAGCDETVTFSVSASVSDGGTLSYKWEKEEGGAWTATDGSRNAYSFRTPLISGWESVKYRITVTNTLQAGGKTLTAQKNVDFTVTEDNRLPMPYPELNVSVLVADSAGVENNEMNVPLGIYEAANLVSETYYCPIGVGEDYLIKIMVENSGGGNLSCKWTGKWRDSTDSAKQEQFTTDTDGTVYSLRGRLDEFSSCGDTYYEYTIEITNSDPEGIKRSSITEYRLWIQLCWPLSICFDAGRGMFSDDTKQKTYRIPWKILRSRPVSDGYYDHKNYFYFFRDDFSNWLKEIGMHKDVIRTGQGGVMSCGDVDFCDWKMRDRRTDIWRLVSWNDKNQRMYYLYNAYPADSLEDSVCTFYAQWNIADDTLPLLEKMNMLFKTDIFKLLSLPSQSQSEDALQAYKAEYSSVDNKTRLYYDIGVKDIINIHESTAQIYSVDCTVTANGQEIKRRAYNVDSDAVTVTFCKDVGLAADTVNEYQDAGKNTYINIIPLANFTGAQDGDIALCYGQSLQCTMKPRFSAGPAGCFIRRFEPGHSYRIKFCLYIDHSNKKYGVESFSWKDETDSSAKACMFVQCYDVDNYYGDTFNFSKRMDMDSCYPNRGNWKIQGSQVGGVIAPELSPKPSDMKGFYVYDYFGSYKCVITKKEAATLAVEILNPSEMKDVSYQWYKTENRNESEIEGAQSSALSINQYSRGDVYTCRVTNSANGTSAYTEYIFNININPEYVEIMNGRFCFAIYNNDYCYDFENEKIYLVGVHKTPFSKAANECLSYGSDGLLHLEKLSMALVGVSDDGRTFAEDNTKSVFYHSFETPVYIEPKQYSKSTDIKSTNFKQPSGVLIPSMQEKGEPGFTIKAEDGYIPAFKVRIDLTELPPRIDIFTEQ